MKSSFSDCEGYILIIERINFRMKKLLTIFFVVLILLCSLVWYFGRTYRKGATTPVREHSVRLVCPNGYALTARYHTPDKAGIMTKLSLTVINTGGTQTYEMVPAMSGSGSKFETSDQVYSLWEHQGEFAFALNGNDITICTEEEAVGTMTEAEALAIGKQSCVKAGETLGKGMYNENTNTWWFDATLATTQPGCNPACVVNVETKQAEINWRCTGLLQK